MAIITDFFESNKLGDLQKQLNDFMKGENIDQRDIIKIYYNRVVYKNREYDQDIISNSVMLVYEDNNGYVRK